MKERLHTLKDNSRTLDTKTKALRQASLSEIIQSYSDGQYGHGSFKQVVKTENNAIQMAKEDLDPKAINILFNKILNEAYLEIKKEEKLPDVSLDEINGEILKRALERIDAIDAESIHLYYTANKAPNLAIARIELKEHFTAKFDEKKGEKRFIETITNTRKKQLALRQATKEEQLVLPEYKGTTKTVKVRIEKSVLDQVDWTVIWKRIAKERFIPSHVILPKDLVIYEDPIDKGPHFRDGSSITGNYFHEIEVTKDSLILTILGYWPNAHPSKTNPWEAPKKPIYTDYEFTVTDDFKLTVKTQPKIKKGMTDKSVTNWDITEAQRLALEVRRLQGVPVVPDGFCLTEAIGIGRGTNGGTVRTQVIENLFNASDSKASERNLAIIEAFGSIDQFIIDLTDRTAWAGPRGNYIISVIALVLGINILVMNEDGTITRVDSPNVHENILVTRVVRGVGAHYGAARPIPE